MGGRMRLVSVNDAIEGIIYAFRHQSNIRFHFLATALVLVLSVVLGVSRTEFMILAVVIGMVLAAELMNSAVEGSVDLIADHFHPLAKVVKDVAAGAVLVASITAFICGYIIFYPLLGEPLGRGLSMVKRAPAYITLLALIFTVMVVVVAKSRFGRGTPLHGGMPSGHAAVSFGIAAAVALSSADHLVVFLVYALAAMVSHSRLLHRIHTLREVVMGALLGTLVTIFFFQVFG